MAYELLYLRALEVLPGLRLPGEHAVLGDALVEDVLALLMAERDEEDVVAGAVGDGDDPLKSPRAALGRERHLRREDVVDLFSSKILVELQRLPVHPVHDLPP